MLKSLVILILLMIVSRLIDLPENFSPIIAFAIFIPRLTDNLYLQHLLPASIIIITNLFLEPVDIIILSTILLVFLITPLISKYCENLFLSVIYTVLIWHILVNGAVWNNVGGSILEIYMYAVPFDLKLLISSWLYIALFYFAERFWIKFSNSNIKLSKKFNS